MARTSNTGAARKLSCVAIVVRNQKAGCQPILFKAERSQVRERSALQSLQLSSPCEVAARSGATPVAAAASAAAGRHVFAAIAESVADAWLPVAASWLHQPSVVRPAGVPGPVSAGAVAVPFPVVRSAFPAVSGISGPPSHFQYLARQGARSAQDPWGAQRSRGGNSLPPGDSPPHGSAARGPSLLLCLDWLELDWLPDDTGLRLP
jgi:hypothetical protein